MKFDSGVSVFVCAGLGVVGGGMIGVADGGAVAGEVCTGDVGVAGADLVVTVAVAGAVVTVAGAGGIASGAVGATTGAVTGAMTTSSMLSTAGTGRGLISAETWKRSVLGCMRIVCVNCLEF